MTPTKQLIGALLKKSPHGVVLNIPEYLERELARVDKIERGIRVAKERKRIAKLEYDKLCEQENKAIVAIQECCKHEETLYFGDPAGGSDSHHECQICGKISHEGFAR